MAIRPAGNVAADLQCKLEYAHPLATISCPRREVKKTESDQQMQTDRAHLKQR